MSIEHPKINRRYLNRYKGPEFLRTLNGLVYYPKDETGKAWVYSDKIKPIIIENFNEELVKYVNEDGNLSRLQQFIDNKINDECKKQIEFIYKDVKFNTCKPPYKEKVDNSYEVSVAIKELKNAIEQTNGLAFYSGTYSRNILLDIESEPEIEIYNLPEKDLDKILSKLNFEKRGGEYYFHDLKVKPSPIEIKGNFFRLKKEFIKPEKIERGLSVDYMMYDLNGEYHNFKNGWEALETKIISFNENFTAKDLLDAAYLVSEKGFEIDYSSLKNPKETKIEENVPYFIKMSQEIIDNSQEPSKFFKTLRKTGFLGQVATPFLYDTHNSYSREFDGFNALMNILDYSVNIRDFVDNSKYNFMDSIFYQFLDSEYDLSCKNRELYFNSIMKGRGYEETSPLLETIKTLQEFNKKEEVREEQIIRLVKEGKDVDQIIAIIGLKEMDYSQDPIKAKETMEKLIEVKERTQKELTKEPEIEREKNNFAPIKNSEIERNNFTR